MEGSVQQRLEDDQDRNRPSSVRAVCAAIREGEHQGRPTFHAADVRSATGAGGRRAQAWRLRAHHPGGGREERTGPIVPHPEVAVFLDAPSAESSQLLTSKPRAVDQMRHLAAAALHDLYDWPLTQLHSEPSGYWERDDDGILHNPERRSIAYDLSYDDGASWRPPRTEEEERLAICKDGRSARRAVASGRALWAKLAAWPWWPLAAGGHWSLADGGRLPDSWRAIPDVVANLAAWRDPQAFLTQQAKTRASGRTIREAA
jgi:hypothetical protein